MGFIQIGTTDHIYTLAYLLVMESILEKEIQVEKNRSKYTLLSNRMLSYLLEEAQVGK